MVLCARAAAADHDMGAADTEYKAACIMNCCRVISTILTIMSKDGQGVGADEFLPALIYTVIHANPDRLFSNLK